MIKKIGFDWFIIFLLSVIFIAWLFPSAGAKDSAFPFTIIGNVGVAIIFFFYGLRLGLSQILRSLKNWPLHLVIQTTTFLFFPIVIFFLRPIIIYLSSELIWTGMFFLACLPSTVSTAVVMTSIAGGNIPAAIFNAGVSMLLGIFITPLWMGLYLGTSTTNFEYIPVIYKLVLQVFIPVVAGMLLHIFFGKFADRNKKYLRIFDQGVILLIVYTVFCESFKNKAFQVFSWSTLLVIFVMIFCLFGIITAYIIFLSKVLKINTQDKITAFFCSSTKSLVHGTVMSKVLFSGSSVTGVILLPLMIYHAIQLILVSVIAKKHK